VPDPGGSTPRRIVTSFAWGPTDQKGDAMATSPWPLIHAEREGLTGHRNGLATLRSRS